MRAVIQRALKKAQVKVNNEVSGTIDKGLVVLLGIEEKDSVEDIEWLSNKIVNLRIFNDNEGKMNLSVKDIKGGILVISQFTLYASTKKGNRPSYLRSANPDFAKVQYMNFIQHLESVHSMPVSKGIFGAPMQIEFVNDGPVTIIIDTKRKE